MYLGSRRVNQELSAASGFDAVRQHIGIYRSLVDSHVQQVASIFASEGIAGLRALRPHIMGRINDDRTLRYAAALLDPHSSPGPSGLRLAEMDDASIWPLCHQLGRAMRERTYRPGPERIHHIPKLGQPRKFRKLTIQSTEDRIVGKAALLILQPVVDPTFSRFSFGFRPQLGRMQALATAIAIMRARNFTFWVLADVAHAFDAIPLDRLLVACEQHFPADVVNFVRLIAETNKPRGIRQGSPLSPMLANVFFNHFLDQPWARRHPDLPLLRYADDLAVVCESAEQAAVAHNSLGQLARSAGTPLKSASCNMFDLANGQAIEWLGYLLRQERGHLAMRIADTAFAKLEEHLSEAHFRTHAPIRAREIIRGWLIQVAPCFAFENVEAVSRRIRHTAELYAFDEIDSSAELVRYWRTASENISASHDLSYDFRG